MTDTKQNCYETNDQSKVECKHLNKHIERHIRTFREDIILSRIERRLRSIAVTLVRVTKLMDRIGTT